MKIRTCIKVNVHKNIEFASKVYLDDNHVHFSSHIHLMSKKKAKLNNYWSFLFALKKPNKYLPRGEWKLSPFTPFYSDSEPHSPSSFRRILHRGGIPMYSSSFTHTFQKEGQFSRHSNISNFVCINF